MYTRLGPSDGICAVSVATPNASSVGTDGAKLGFRSFDVRTDVGLPPRSCQRMSEVPWLCEWPQPVIPDMTVRTATLRPELCGAEVLDTAC